MSLTSRVFLKLVNLGLFVYNTQMFRNLLENSGAWASKYLIKTLKSALFKVFILGWLYVDLERLSKGDDYLGYGPVSGASQGSKVNLVIFCLEKVWKYIFSTTLYDMEHHFIESRYEPIDNKLMNIFAKNELDERAP